MNKYTESEIITLEWNEHIRRRPGMYIGKLGDGSSPDDGIYVLIKEVMDNSVDEYAMGNGKEISIDISDNVVSIRDYGRGIPLGSLIDAASKMNTGAKYDNKAFKKSVGLNGVGIKAVNALSSSFIIQSFREGECRTAEFSKGVLVSDNSSSSNEKNGTKVKFVADETLFGHYHFNYEFIESMFRNYSYLNTGLVIKFNDKEFVSKNGLLDLLNETLTKEPLYPAIHLKGDDIEIAITHGNDYGEGISSFVNGQYTTQGGTHLSAFREAVAKTIKDFFKRDIDPSDIRQSMIAAISIKVQEPVFESQTKTKLGSKEMYEILLESF